MQPTCNKHPVVPYRSCVQTRNYAVFSAASLGAGIAAAGGTMTMRVFGYNVPYPVVLGTALAMAGGVYWYECVHTAREKGGPVGPARLRVIVALKHRVQAYWSAWDIPGMRKL